MSVDNKYWDLQVRQPRPVRDSNGQYRNTFRVKRSSDTSNRFHKLSTRQNKRKVYNPKFNYTDNITFSETYITMLSDERIYPVMRMYKPEAKYLAEAVNVYKFYFNELKHNLDQRMQTLHLAFAYFTQTIMRCPCLQK
jgi:hypothetical protein